MAVISIQVTLRNVSLDESAWRDSKSDSLQIIQNPHGCMQSKKNSHKRKCLKNSIHDQNEADISPKIDEYSSLNHHFPQYKTDRLIR
jgi:hypothetical protein